MHRAPAVIFSVTKSRWHLYLIVWLTLLAVMSVGVFVYTQPTSDGLAWMPVVASPVTIAVALVAWHNSPVGLLHWDGRSWHWSGFAAAQACSLSLLLDFQKVVLVSLKRPGMQPVWLWLQAAPGDLSWIAVRRAIVSGHGTLGVEREADSLQEDRYVA